MDWIHSKNNYPRILKSDGKQIIISKPLKYSAELLRKYGFLECIGHTDQYQLHVVLQ